MEQKSQGRADMLEIDHIIQKHATSFGLFLSVGAISALVNFLSFAFFWHTLGLHYQVAVTFAYILSVITHFTGNRHFTFKQANNALSSQISKYLVMVALNYCVTLFVMHTVVVTFHLSPYLGIIASIAATISTGYIMSRCWVFTVSTEQNQG